MNDQIQKYLNEATKGLDDDPELRRDVRAELAAHLDDKTEALRAEGRPEEDCREEALKAMGDLVELAGELQQANRRRMRWRAQVRLLLRFALVPVAVVVALLTSDIPSMRTREMLTGLAGAGATPGYIVPPLASIRERLFDPRPTPKEALVLHGDIEREDRAGQQRAIWEAVSTNRVYLGNYISSLIVSERWEDLDQTDYLRAELQAAREVEPDNARFDLLEAALLLDRSADVNAEKTPQENTARSDRDPLRYSLTIRDPATLDEAMALLRSGLEKLYFRRYGADMLKERMDIYGPAERFGDQLRRTSLAASTLVPDVHHLLLLSRASIAYGEILLEGGRREEADVHLEAPYAMGRHLANDSDFFIDVLIVGALFNIGAEQGAAVYNRAGLDPDASPVAAQARAAAKPLDTWNEALRAMRESPEAEEGVDVIRQRGGLLASILLPATDSYPAAPAYEAGRRLEYTVATEVLLSIISLAFLMAMSGCLIVALRWRFFGSRGAAIPILLVPGLRRSARTIALGVLLPMAVFLFITRCLAWSGHSYSASFGSHKLIAEFTLLTIALAAAPVMMTLRAVKKRCRALGIPVATFAAQYILWGTAIASMALIILWLTPAQDAGSVGLAALADATRFAKFTLLSISRTGVLVALLAATLALTMYAMRMRRLNHTLPVRTFAGRLILWSTMILIILCLVLPLCVGTHRLVGPVLAAAIAAVVAVVTLDLFALAAWLQGLLGNKNSGLYYGTLFRSLIPVFAAVVIILGLGTRPFLLRSEATYLARDTLMNDPSLPGFSKVENDLAQRLKNETLAALSAIDALDDAE